MDLNELKQEAKEYADWFWGASPSMMKALANAYIKGAEPREKRIEELEATNKKISNECHKLVDSLEKKQKVIAELEKEKCELLGVIQGKDEAIKDLEWQLQEVAKDNEDYQKENAELKHAIAELRREKDILNTHTKAQEKLAKYRGEQLAKAKEIIKKLKALYFSPVVTKDDVKRQDEILAEVEQFLNSEVEK